MKQNNFESSLETLLTNGVAKFSFVKKNGEIREAVGTKKFIPEDHAPKGTGTESPGVITYFDLEKNSWRALRQGSVTSVYMEESYKLTEEYGKGVW